MSLLDDYRRPARGERCPICGKRDWCLLAREGGSEPVSALCKREPSPITWGEAGYLHRLREGPIAARCPRPFVPPPEPVDHRAEAERLATGAPLDPIAAALGLPTGALRRLGVGWSSSERCSTWPTWNASGKCIGIVRRSADGTKRLRKGDHPGLYLPRDLPEDLSSERILLVEGGSDTAAGLALGRWAVGRFSCDQGGKLLARLATRRRMLAATIVFDNDAKRAGVNPGLAGALKLRETLRSIVPDLRLVSPPANRKDLREWLRAGATGEDLARAEREAR
jgi:hypothetical protein